MFDDGTAPFVAKSFFNGSWMQLRVNRGAVWQYFYGASAPIAETDQSMSTVATESNVLLSIPKVETSMDQVVRRAADLHARHQLGASDERFGPQHEYRLAELEKALLGVSPSMAAIRQLILEVAPTRASVMIYGESGTGKELVAQAIHRHSKQSSGPFVPVNMAAIPHGLAESLLFGHEKGAFTSAVHNQKGWCEAADGGTLFLDEVGDMEIQVQPKLLRFLQEGTLQRVGSQVSQPVRVRVIKATNCDPGLVVTDGRMRDYM
jgi:DNA-binding NtrC family response regulator